MKINRTRPLHKRRTPHALSIKMPIGEMEMLNQLNDTINPYISVFNSVEKELKILEKDEKLKDYTMEQLAAMAAGYATPHRIRGWYDSKPCLPKLDEEELRVEELVHAVALLILEIRRLNKIRLEGDMLA